jgi:hypothetical protein
MLCAWPRIHTRDDSFPLITQTLGPILNQVSVDKYPRRQSYRETRTNEQWSDDSWCTTATAGGQEDTLPKSCQPSMASYLNFQTYEVNTAHLVEMIS